MTANASFTKAPLLLSPMPSVADTRPSQRPSARAADAYRRMVADAATVNPTTRFTGLPPRRRQRTIGVTVMQNP